MDDFGNVTIDMLNARKARMGMTNSDFWRGWRWGFLFASAIFIIIHFSY